MTLYLLYWDNGLEYDDWAETLLGVYSSIGLRADAILGYRESDGFRLGHWPFSTLREGGHFVTSELKLDENIVYSRRAV